MKLPYFETQSCNDFELYTIKTIVEKDKCTKKEACDKMNTFDIKDCFYNDGTFSIRLGIIKKLIKNNYINKADIFGEEI